MGKDVASKNANKHGFYSAELMNFKGLLREHHIILKRIDKNS